VQMSKRNFKMAIGVLYKNRMITIEKGEIQLIEVV
jgi:predicted RNA-binding protein (virulence factor B family)